jgi:hypothetical protein
LAVVDKASHIQLKKIEIARDYGSRVEIASGLSASDEIVRNPPESLAQGDMVHLAEMAGQKEGDQAKGPPKLAEDAIK